jgi:hypothetical protein
MQIASSRSFVWADDEPVFQYHSLGHVEDWWVGGGPLRAETRRVPFRALTERKICEDRMMDARGVKERFTRKRYLC